MARTTGRKGAVWARLTRQVFLEESHCWWCGKAVDQTLPRTHPMSRTADHITEIHLGGHPTDRDNLALMHRRCNSQKSNQMRSAAAGRYLSVDPATI